MTSITIPRSIKAAQAKLTELGELATATEWHRAAIVASYVQPGHGEGRPPSIRPESDGYESARSFAARGIVGLTSASTVLIYAKAWLDRFERPRPGQKVTLPDDPWPPTALEDDRYSRVDDREAIIAAAEAAGTGASKAVDIAKNKAAMAAAIQGSPAVAAAAAAALAGAHPTIAAEAVVGDPDADMEVSRVRTERLRGRPGASEMRERIRDREERMDDAMDESTTDLERTGLAEHEGNVFARLAAMYMTKANAEYERNPVLIGDQQDRHDEAWARIEHQIRVHKGVDEWTASDDAFLSDLGIEGVTS